MPKNTGISSADRARRAALLCCHFARSFAYYSIFQRSPDLDKEGFWLTIHGNFVDVCVLEWCKLFGSDSGEYYWKKTLSAPDVFKRELLDMHHINNAALDIIWKEIKDYRDKFVAHSEHHETTIIPNLNVPYLMVGFYFGKLQSEFPALQEDSSLPRHFDRYYDCCLKEAEEVLRHSKLA